MTLEELQDVCLQLSMPKFTANPTIRYDIGRVAGRVPATLHA